MTARKWSDENMMTFVRLYEKEPILWDPSNDDYRNKSARNAALERIVGGVDVDNFTVKDCKIKIKNLRSHYWQEVGKIERSLISSNGRYKPSVVWFKTVNSFLRKFVSQNGLSNLEKKINTIELEVTSDDGPEKEYAEETPDQNETSSADRRFCYWKANEIPLNGQVVTQNVKRTRSSEDYSNRPHSYDSEVQTKFRRISGIKNKDEYDTPTHKRAKVSDACTIEDGRHSDIKVLKSVSNEAETEFDLWARSVAKQLNDMEPSVALALQLKLQSLLTEERIAYYERSRSNTKASEDRKGPCSARHGFSDEGQKVTQERTT